MDAEHIPHLSAKYRLGSHSSPVVLDTSILQYSINQIQVLILIMATNEDYSKRKLIVGSMISVVEMQN